MGVRPRSPRQLQCASPKQRFRYEMYASTPARNRLSRPYCRADGVTRSSIGRVPNCRPGCRPPPPRPAPARLRPVDRFTFARTPCPVRPSSRCLCAARTGDDLLRRRLAVQHPPPRLVDHPRRQRQRRSIAVRSISRRSAQYRFSQCSPIPNNPHFFALLTTRDE